MDHSVLLRCLLDCAFPYLVLLGFCIQQNQPSAIGLALSTSAFACCNGALSGARGWLGRGPVVPRRVTALFILGMPGILFSPPGLIKKQPVAAFIFSGVSSAPALFLHGI